MAAMVGARRALLAARCSPRGALVSPARRVDSPASLPAEMGCLPSLVPHRGAGNLAPERFDGDHDHEWGSRNGGNYREFHARHPTDRLNKQVQANLPSDYSSAGAGRTRGGNGADSVNTHYKRNSEQAHQIGGSYGFPDHREPYTSAKVNNESPAYKSRQSYGSVNGHYGHNPEPYTSAKVNNETSGFSVRQPYGGSAYDRQRPTRDLPSAHQQYNSTQGNNGVSGYDTGHTNHHPNGYDTSRSGYYTQNNQQNYNNGQYGYGPSGQSNQQLTGNDRPFFPQQSVDQRSPGDYPNRSGRTSQYPNPSGLHKEGQNGDFGYHVSQTDQRPYVGSKIDTQRNYPGLPMNVNTNDQGTPHGVHQPNHSGIQYNLSTGNPLNSAPYQGAAYCQNILSEETSGKPKVTVEEMDKLCEDGKVKEALEVLALLQEEGTVVNAPHYFKLIQACGDAAALAEARTIHNQISQSALATDIDVNNLILEMYAKCGSMEDAKNLFNTIGQHNLTSWNTMISGYAQNGLGEEATEFFDRFNKTGDKPDPGMFTHVFYACGILASVDEGMLHFESMQKDFGITPTMEHYAGIVNMLGQSGYIDEAREFVERMPVEPSIDVWENLMNMCRLNGFLELGDRCARIIERLDPSRLNEQSKTGLFPVNASELAKEKERKKANAVETRSKVHEYRAGDRSHPEQHKIYEELRYLAAHMKEAGYVADTRFVLHDVDPETKEEALLAHSERLAVSYGIITSAPRAPIRVIKNLRSCGDCHTAFKIISKLVGRLIVARDAKRFHHFENGVCSCKDYW